MCAGVVALQAYAFWILVNGQRFARSDAWDAGGSFIRAPFSSQSLFVLYLAAAALLYYASARLLSGRRFLVLFAAVAILGGGLLASMGRALWLTGALGLVVVFWNVPWDRRTLKAAAVVSAGAVFALMVVIVIDRLSPSSSGNWTGSAATFLLDLASSESTSRVTREMEWRNAIDVWLKSPVVGVGFGHAYPVITYGLPPEAEISEAFFIHNTYLNILAKCGVFGLGSLLYLIWVTFGAIRALRRHAADAYGRVLVIGLMATMVQVTLLAAMVPVLSASDTVAYVAMTIGVVAALQRTEAS
jgi:O-antigen ligase